MSSINKTKKGLKRDKVTGHQIKPEEKVIKTSPKPADESKKLDPIIDEHTNRIINVRKIMRERDKCRLETEDFAKSDKLRETLKELGVDVVDQKNGPSGWKFIDGSSNKLQAGTSVPDDAIRKRKVEEVEEPEVKSQKTKKNAKDDKPEVQSSKKDEMERNKSLLNGVLGKGSAPGVKVVQGVRMEDITIGTGKKAESGKKCKMHYVGRLKSTNNVFDSSKNKPFAFKLGRSEVIRGWDIGVEGMLVGGKRILTIPPEKGYGKGGAPPTIPPNATLIFEVTLLEVN